MSEQSRATLAAATTGILVGAAMVSTRAVADAVSPQTLAFLRYLVGVAFLALPALALARPRMRCETPWPCRHWGYSSSACLSCF